MSNRTLHASYRSQFHGNDEIGWLKWPIVVRLLHLAPSSTAFCSHRSERTRMARCSASFQRWHGWTSTLGKKPAIWRGCLARPRSSDWPRALRPCPTRCRHYCQPPGAIAARLIALLPSQIRPNIAPPRTLPSAAEGTSSRLFSYAIIMVMTFMLGAQFVMADRQNAGPVDNPTRRYPARPSITARIYI